MPYRVVCRNDWFEVHVLARQGVHILIHIPLHVFSLSRSWPATATCEDFGSLVDSSEHV